MSAIKTALAQTVNKTQIKSTIYPYNSQGPAELIVHQAYGVPDSMTSFEVGEPVL